VQGYISHRPRTARLATKMKTIMTFLMLALVAGCGRSNHSTWSRTASQGEIGPADLGTNNVGDVICHIEKRTHIAHENVVAGHSPDHLYEEREQTVGQGGGR